MAPLSHADEFQLYQLPGLDALVLMTRTAWWLCCMTAVRPDYNLPEDLAAPGSSMTEAYTSAKQTEAVVEQSLRGEGAWYVAGVMGVTELPAERAVLVQHLLKSQALETWPLDGGVQPDCLATYLPGGAGVPLTIPPLASEA